MKVVAQTGTTDRQLAFIGGTEARTDEYARHKIEDIFQIGVARLLDFFGANDLRATRNTLDLLSRFLFTTKAVWYSLRGQWNAFDDHRRQRCGGLLCTDRGKAY